MNDPQSPNPLALLLNQEEQKTRRALIKEIAAFTGLLAAPVPSLLADSPIPIDLPTPKPHKNKTTRPSLQTRTITLSAPESTECPTPIPGDINGDCSVDAEDLQIMQSDWLTTDSSARSNIDSAYSYLYDSAIGHIPGCDSAYSHLSCCSSALGHIPCCESASSRVYVDFFDFQILAENWLK